MSAHATLPIIHIAPYLTPGETKGRMSTSAALHAACLDYGFFYLDISSHVDKEETDELEGLARKFFELPQEEKDGLGLGNEDGARGYARFGENITNGKSDAHEALDLYRPVSDPDTSRPLWGTNQWPAPTSVPGFREKYEAWVEKMKKLGVVVMEAMAIGLGMTPDEWEALKAQVDDSFWVLRVIGYPPLPEGHDGFSCGAHKDYGCLTFLYADRTKGALQVFLRSSDPAIANGTLGERKRDGEGEGGEKEGEEAGVWIDADPIPGCVVCNIGEMWETWSNGLYKSTLHRVLHRGTNYRVSIPFFFEPNFDARVEPLAAALRLQGSTPANGKVGGETKADGTDNAGQPANVHGNAAKKYPPVVYGEFLMRKVGGNFAGGEKKGKYS